MVINEIEDGGLTVVRQGIDPLLTRDFQQEWDDRLAELVHVKGLDELGSHVLSVGNFAGDFKDLSSPTARLLQYLGITNPYLNVTINYQPRRAAQVFHQDDRGTQGGVLIGHAHEGGAFDYAPFARNREEAKTDYKTVELNAGDIVLQSRPFQWHRGRNLDDTPRITTAIADIR